MTDMPVATVTEPAAPAGWRLLPRRDRVLPAFYVDDPKVLLSNKLDATDWSADAFATLIDGQNSSELSPAHQRRIYLVFPDTPLAHLDGFGLSEVLADLAGGTGCYITLATYRRDIAQGLGGVSDMIRRHAVTYNNDLHNQRQPGVLIELCTQEFFLKHIDHTKTRQENEQLRWRGLYRLMSAFTADGLYSSDPYEILKRGLFLQEHTGFNELVVVRRGEYHIEMMPYLVHNVRRCW